MLICYLITDLFIAGTITDYIITVIITIVIVTRIIYYFQGQLKDLNKAPAKSANR
jgi:hypothetical protein